MCGKGTLALRASDGSLRPAANECYPELAYGRKARRGRAITDGGVPHQRGARAQAPSGTSAIVNRVTSAPYRAFGDGLHVALTLFGSLLCAAAVIALLVPKRPSQGAPQHRGAHEIGQLAVAQGRRGG